jgi:hypothetical protein
MGFFVVRLSTSRIVGATVHVNVDRIHQLLGLYQSNNDTQTVKGWAPIDLLYGLPPKKETFHMGWPCMYIMTKKT